MNNEKDLFNKIKFQDPDYPLNLQKEDRDILNKIFVKDPSSRCTMKYVISKLKKMC